MPPNLVTRSTLVEHLMKIKFAVFAQLKLRSKMIDPFPGAITPTMELRYIERWDMSTYLEFLQSHSRNAGKDCGLGKILREEGQAKHDQVLEAIFSKDKKGRLYPVSWLCEAFGDEYGWSEFFFRRHRDGRCVSCLNR